MSHEEWVRIDRHSDWGAFYYLYGGSSADRRYALALQDGLTTELMWPDGTVEQHALASVGTTTEYTDHGDRWPTKVHTREFGIWSKVHGRRTWFPLEQFRVRRGAFALRVTEPVPSPEGGSDG